MRRAAVLAAVLALLPALGAWAHDGFGYPDWIRLKDSTAVRCRILGETKDGVEVIMSGGRGDGTVTIDRAQIEWMRRKSSASEAETGGGAPPPPPSP